MAQYPIRSSSDDEAAKEVDSVDISGSHRNRLSNRSNEANDVDEDACDVGCVSSPMETGCEVIGRSLFGGIEILNLKVAAAHKVVIAHHDTSD